MLLGTEATTAADLLLRQALRKSIPTLAARASLPQLPFLPPPPNPLEVPAPFLLPSPESPGGVRAVFLPPGDVLEARLPLPHIPKRSTLTVTLNLNPTFHPQPQPRPHPHPHPSPEPKPNATNQA